MEKENGLPIIAFQSTAEWSAWLSKNAHASKGVWMKLSKKGAEEKTITYAEALEEALCHGWIDGQKKALDTQAWLQKFTARSPRSIWSKVNIAHIERLTKAGKMRTQGLKEAEAAKNDGRWEKAYDAQSTMSIPEDFMEALRKNKKAHEFYKTLNNANIFSISFRLQTAKKPETRKKRMQLILEMLTNGQKFH